MAGVSTRQENLLMEITMWTHESTKKLRITRAKTARAIDHLVSLYGSRAAAESDCPGGRPADLREMAENCGMPETPLQRECRGLIELAFANNTVNGVAYPTAMQAEAVRSALRAAGIGWHYPGTPQAHAVLDPLGL